ncbi:MAG: DUF4442 domain-containing protein [Polaribacter sp.]|nr:DUF4442 domain-containing protein [Polaribacter sp.]MDG1529695.1 DUF4442 domain-containing protein [Polaribacter sp.]MDG1811548.1 DUF4442 domain-containing protein [Polaribacter sp.]MDG1994773.1 DUF4442 domain-containing protein [Polaribacter sp.]
MKITPRKINLFMLFKLPSAYFCGVRVVSISDSEAVVKVKHRWINQNPFKSLYWAVQGMASEFANGILVMQEIKKTNRKISMLVTHQEGRFTKKATGKILFKCSEGNLVKEAIHKSIETGEGQIIHLKTDGIDANGELVSQFVYEWSIKVKE